MSYELRVTQHSEGRRQKAEGSNLPSPLSTQKAEGSIVTPKSAIRNPQSAIHIVSMPGVPFEMKRMWEREVEPKLRALSASVIVSRTLKTMGLGESRVEEVVKDLMIGSNPTLAPYAKSDGIHLRLTAKAGSREQAEELIGPLESAVRSRLGDAIYGVDDDTPQSVLGSMLDRLGYTLVVLEIGDGAPGAVSSLIGAHSLCLGAFGGRDIAVVARNVGYPSDDNGDPTLSQLALATRREVGADVAVAVSVALEPRGDNGNVVKFQVEVVVSVGMGEQEEEPTVHKWRVARSEVSRLVGLAALNQLRQRLLIRAKV